MKFLQDVPEQPAPRPLHWLYYVLYALALTAGLWQHGHPYVALSLIIAVPILGFCAYIPQRHFSAATRSVCQHVLGVMAILWIAYRVQMRTPMDLLLVEAFSIMGAGFVFSTVPKSYGFILLMSIMLIGYGALLPPRVLFLIVLPPAIGIFFTLLYNTRIAGLAGGQEVEFRGTITRQNLKPILGHALIACLALPLIASVIPSRGNNPHIGLAPSSHDLNSHINVAPRLTNWFRTPNVQRSATANQSMSGPDPTESSRYSDQIVPNLPGPPTMGQDGNGSGPPGKDLVMQVQSPLKLYWLAQLYDRYDGKNWRQTDEFVDLSIRRSGRIETNTSVPQTFIIEKWVSASLYSAFLRESTISATSPSIRTQRNWFSERLVPGQHFPEPPFRYTIRSTILSPDAVDVPWSEYQLTPEHYLQLPEKAITARVREKTLQITSDIPETDHLARALALRDFLRTSFGYTTTPPAVPEGREAVDFLLFDLEEAHCQYFAAALAVMCRINGIPSRVATGFSPGDYNTLTGMFEVYEYHAHAWTQVYVAGKGWITMDGTPPAARQLQLRNTPMVIGDFRDPFSDDWQVRAPELSRDVAAFKYDGATANFDAAEALNGNSPNGSQLSRADETRTASDQVAARLKMDGMAENPGTFAAITTNFKSLLFNIKRRWYAFVQFFSLSQLTAIITGSLLLIIFLMLLPKLVEEFVYRRRLARLHRWYAIAEASANTEPQMAVMHCYRVIREVLQLAGFQRDPHLDLFQYGDELARHSRQLSTDAMAVFRLYSALRYSRDPLRPVDAAVALQHTAAIRDRLLPEIEK